MKPSKEDGFYTSWGYKSFWKEVLESWDFTLCIRHQSTVFLHIEEFTISTFSFPALYQNSCALFLSLWLVNWSVAVIIFSRKCHTSQWIWMWVILLMGYSGHVETSGHQCFHTFSFICVSCCGLFVRELICCGWMLWWLSSCCWKVNCEEAVRCWCCSPDLSSGRWEDPDWTEVIILHFWLENLYKLYVFNCTLGGANVVCSLCYTVCLLYNPLFVPSRTESSFYPV